MRLVQSAFGASEGWDDLFDGMKAGWTYFLQNLRIYLERHLGRVRRMISERIEVEMPRQEFWRHLLSGAAGFVIGGAGPVKAGDWIDLKLSEPGSVRAVVEMLIEGQGLGLRISAPSGASTSLSPDSRARATDAALARPSYLVGRRWSRKNAHIRPVASMLWFVAPTSHSGSGPPPGQECPPPSTV